MSLVPPPYPDEVFGSVLIRAARRTGLPVTRIHELISHGREVSAGFLLPNGIGQLAVICGMSPDYFLRQHTMFPYVVAFMAPEVRKELAEKCLRRVGRGESLAVLSQTVTQGVPFRRVCPKCIEDDVRQFGESFWHRAHLLPAVEICVKHRVRLRSSTIPLKRSSLNVTLLLPEDVESRMYRQRLNGEVLCEIADVSVGLLNEELAPLSGQLVEYRSAALDKGYKNVGGMVATAPLAADLNRFFGSAFLSLAGCPVQGAWHSPWPALMVRSDAPRLTFTTVKHILLRTFLRLAPAPSGDFPYKKPGKKPSDHRREDMNAVHKIQAILRAHEGQPVRFTAKGLLEQVGAWTAFRHHRADYPVTNAFLQTFRATDQSERQIGRRPYWRKKLKLDD